MAADISSETGGLNFGKASAGYGNRFSPQHLVRGIGSKPSQRGSDHPSEEVGPVMAAIWFPSLGRQLFPPRGYLHQSGFHLCIGPISKSLPIRGSGEGADDFSGLSGRHGEHFLVVFLGQVEVVKRWLG